MTDELKMCVLPLYVCTASEKQLIERLNDPLFVNIHV